MYYRKYHKIKNYFIFELIKKKIWVNLQRIIIPLPQKLAICSQKGLGSAIPKKPDPDPQHAYKYTCKLSNYHVDNVVETDPLFGNANFTPDLLIVFFGGIQFLGFSMITGVIKSVSKNAIEKYLLEILPGIKIEARCA